MVLLFLFLFFSFAENARIGNNLIGCSFAFSLSFWKIVRTRWKEGRKLKRKGKMGFEPAVQMWSLSRYG